MPEAMTLNDVCTSIVDCEHKTAPESAPGQGYGYSVGTPNIRNGRILLDSAKRVDRTTYDLWTARAVPQKDDIILTREAPAGEAGLVDGTTPVCLGQRTVLLRPNQDLIVPRYLHYRLLSPILQEHIHAKSEGSTVAHLNVKEIRNLSLGDLPCKEKQKAIAELLGALDDKIAVNYRIASDALNLAEAEFFQLSAGTTEIKKLGEVLELKYGKALPASIRVPGEFSVYGSGGIAGSHNTALLSGPGVVVGRKGTVGAVYWSENGFFPIDTTFYVQLKQPGMPMEFAYFMLKSLGLDDMNSDSAVPGLNRSNALALQVKVPAEGELRKFHAVARPLFALRETVSGESASLAQLRDTLLPKLMSGQIRVRDAEKVVEDAVLWAAGCRKTLGNTSSWTSSGSWGGSRKKARRSLRVPGSGSPGMR